MSGAHQNAAGATLVLAACSLTHAAPLLASEAGHGGAQAARLSSLLFPAINFAIFAVIIARYVVPALREHLRRRSADIAAVAEEARAALVAAQEALATVERQRTGLAAESESIRHDLAAVASRQAQRLLVHTEESAQRRLADAALVAEQERRRALEAVRAETAAAAAEIAEVRIRAALTPHDQEAFVRRLLTDVTTR
jgi:F-type H+-transporting ATPase subunit b